ncbi:MAG TPA: chemotaxis protein CheW [Methylomirabilota bacterium]|nr:chemotaxis protein CheW [Methylomirabilota bacterium]
MTERSELDAQSYVLLRLEDRQFALPAKRIAELVPLSRVFRFPHCSPEVEGVLIRRGRILAVCDISPRLAARPLKNRRLYLLAVRDFAARPESVAVPVTGECELISAEMTPATGGQPPHVRGWISHDGNVIEVLDLDNLIPGPTAAPNAVQAGVPQEALP